MIEVLVIAIDCVFIYWEHWDFEIVFFVGNRRASLLLSFGKKYANQKSKLREVFRFTT